MYGNSNWNEHEHELCVRVYVCVCVLVRASDVAALECCAVAACAAHYAIACSLARPTLLPLSLLAVNRFTLRAKLT